MVDSKSNFIGLHTKRPFGNGHQKKSTSKRYFEKSLKDTDNGLNIFFLPMRGVLFTQRDANFDSIDQQANKQLLTPYNQNSNLIKI